MPPHVSITRHQVGDPVLQVFVDSTMPIIEHYKARGKVRDIDATRSPDEVYQDVRPLFEDL
jgi:UMP-CMP kinase